LAATIVSNDGDAATEDKEMDVATIR